MSKRGQHNVHLDSEPIARHVEDWLNANGGKAPNSFVKREASCSPIEALAFRMGVDRSVVEQLLRRKFRSVTFDKADRFLCAIDQPQLWYSDPELSGVYEEACRTADVAYPIVELAA